MYINKDSKLSEIAIEISKCNNTPVIICTTKQDHSDLTKMGYYATNNELLSLLEGVFENVLTKFTNGDLITLNCEESHPLSGLNEAFKKTHEEIQKLRSKQTKIEKISMNSLYCQTGCSHLTT